LNSKIKVYEGTDQIVVSLLQAKLNSNNIECWILNQQDSAYGVFGTISLFVSEDQADSARQIISEN
jgi:Protein of unknown function (DUF2007).